MKDAFTERSAVVIVAKRPIPGNVKTRLCPPLSCDEAAELYACFLEDTINKIGALPGVSKYLAIDGEKPESSAISLPGSFKAIGQGTGNLGDRLNHLSHLLFQGVDRLLFVGADSPNLPHLYLKRALEELNYCDVVIGPSEDGGYYLIGMRNHFSCLFNNIDWSTSLVFEQTVNRAQGENLKVGIISTWYDVDTGDSLLKLMSDLQDNPEIAPVTASFLRGLRGGNMLIDR